MADLHQEVVTQFAPVLEALQVPKGAMLQAEGRVCDTLYLLNHSVFRAFYHKDGKDVTAHFAFSRDAIRTPDRFIQAKPSRYNPEALQDCQVCAVRSVELARF